MPELKPCPKCGSTEIEWNYDSLDVSYYSSEWYFCEKCGHRGPIVKSTEDAIAAWNKRANEEEE